MENDTVTDDDFSRIKSETDLVEFYMKLMKERCKKLWE